MAQRVEHPPPVRYGWADRLGAGRDPVAPEEAAVQTPHIGAACDEPCGHPLTLRDQEEGIGKPGDASVEAPEEGLAEGGKEALGNLVGVERSAPGGVERGSRSDLDSPHVKVQSRACIPE